MKRRQLLLGLGTATAGGSALLGSGAFSMVEAHRDISIEVTGDADAYLRLGPCTDENGEPKPNGDYVVERNGEFAIELSEDNDQVPGEGVNPQAISTFHDTFEICNQGTQPICVDFQTEPRAIPDDAEVPEYSDAEPGDPSVVFYEGADESARIDVDELDVGRAGAFHLEPGECQCVGFTVRAFGFTPGTDLFEDSGVTFKAEAGAECKGEDDEDDDDDDGLPETDFKAISFVAFRGTEDSLATDAVSIDDVLSVDSDGDPTEVAWSADSEVEEVVVKAGQGWFRFDVGGDTEGTVVSDPDTGGEDTADAYKDVQGGGQTFVFEDEEETESERCPSSPFLGVEGVKIDHDSGFEFDEPDDTQSSC